MPGTKVGEVGLDLVRGVRQLGRLGSLHGHTGQDVAPVIPGVDYEEFEIRQMGLASPRTIPWINIQHSLHN